MRGFSFLFILVVLFTAVEDSAAQKRNTRPQPKPTVSPTPVNLETAPAAVPEKKRNERPTDLKQSEIKPTDQNNINVPKAGDLPYEYIFERPGFVYWRVNIAHDENGVGTATFEKKDYEEAVTDPLKLSTVTIEKLRSIFAALDFLNSTEDYQFTGRDFSNMGNVTITRRQDGRSRTVKYNWTENKDAKALMDEYRRIGNEAIWRFEIGIARVNQPLNAPSLIDQMDAYLQRGEVSDPPHLLPELEKISTDEHFPLMARNHAAKLVKQIRKKYL